MSQKLLIFLVLIPAICALPVIHCKTVNCSFAGSAVGRNTFIISSFANWTRNDTYVSGLRIFVNSTAPFRLSTINASSFTDPFSNAYASYNNLTKSWQSYYEVPTCTIGNVSGPINIYYKCVRWGGVGPQPCGENHHFTYNGYVFKNVTNKGIIGNNITTWNGTILGDSKREWNISLTTHDKLDVLYKPYIMATLKIYNLSWVNTTHTTFTLGLQRWNDTSSNVTSSCRSKLKPENVVSISFPRPAQLTNYFSLSSALINVSVSNHDEVYVVTLVTSNSSGIARVAYPIYYEIELKIFRRTLGVTKETWAFVAADVFLVIVFAVIIIRLNREK